MRVSLSDLVQRFLAGPPFFWEEGPKKFFGRDPNPLLAALLMDARTVGVADDGLETDVPSSMSGVGPTDHHEVL